MQFPKMIYRGEGTKDHRIVNDEAEYEAAIAEGYRVMGEKPKEPEPDNVFAELDRKILRRKR